MPIRLVALDEGPDIPLDREMLVVGRHPQCDARLDSIRVSRRHCCIWETPDNGEVNVKDLGSTNGIRINGQRVEKGRLRPGDELSIAHIRYRFDDGNAQEMTLAESQPDRVNGGGFRLRAAPPPAHAGRRPRADRRREPPRRRRPRAAAGGRGRQVPHPGHRPDAPGCRGRGSRGMPARLVPLTPGAAPVVPLQRPVLLVGRHPECDVPARLPVRLPATLCVALAYDRLVIRDLGSRHGVWVNGVKTEEAHLQPGDEIAIGHLLFRYEDPEAAAKVRPTLPQPRKDPRDPDGDLLPMSDAFPPA